MRQRDAGDDEETQEEQDGHEHGGLANRKLKPFCELQAPHAHTSEAASSLHLSASSGLFQFAHLALALALLLAPSPSKTGSDQLSPP